MGLEARLPFDAAPDSPRIARGFVADQLRRSGYDGFVASAALLTSELVTNAVLQAPEPFAVGIVDLRDGIAITVEDLGDGDLPSPQHQDPWATGGRGLAIVESLASAWGVSAVPAGGKCVWFRLTGDPGKKARRWRGAVVDASPG